MDKSYEIILKDVSGLKPKLFMILKDIDERLKSLEQSNASTEDDTELVQGDDGLDIGSETDDNGQIPSIPITTDP